MKNNPLAELSALQERHARENERAEKIDRFIERLRFWGGLVALAIALVLGWLAISGYIELITRKW